MFFKKKPTEEQLETTSIWAAEAIYREDSSTKTLSPEPVIKSVIQNLYTAQKLKPDSRELSATYWTVQALLAEGDFIREVLEFREQNPGAPISSEYSRRLRIIAAEFVENATAFSKERRSKT